jgi:glycine hydroxymethyltransferase
LRCFNRATFLMGLSLAHGGHLTHGAAPNVSGKWFRRGAIRRDAKATSASTSNEVRRLAHEHRPKLIVSGCTAYPRVKSTSRSFRAIADEVGAYLMADIAHISGLVAGGAQLPRPSRTRTS